VDLALARTDADYFASFLLLDFEASHLFVNHFQVAALALQLPLEIDFSRFFRPTVATATASWLFTVLHGSHRCAV